MSHFSNGHYVSLDIFNLKEHRSTTFEGIPQEASYIWLASFTQDKIGSFAKCFELNLVGFQKALTYAEEILKSFLETNKHWQIPLTNFSKHTKTPH